MVISMWLCIYAFTRQYRQCSWTLIDSLRECWTFLCDDEKMSNQQKLNNAPAKHPGCLSTRSGLSLCGIWCLPMLGSTSILPCNLCDQPESHSQLYVASQWETMLQCNIVSRWLGACAKWSPILIAIKHLIIYVQCQKCEVLKLWVLLWTNCLKMWQLVLLIYCQTAPQISD